MPPYLLVFLFSAVITPYIGQGPLYPVDGFEPNRCRTAWWTNVLMINNLKITEEKVPIIIRLFLIRVLN